MAFNNVASCLYMTFPPASLVTLARLLRRDGFACFGKLAKCAFSRDAWLWLLRGGSSPTQVTVVKESPWFDPGWMTRKYPQIGRERLDPAEYYLREGLSGLVHPGPDFQSDEYIALHRDLIQSGVNPLVHWEMAGQHDGSALSFHDTEIRFPEGAGPLRKSFQRRPPKTRRTAVFAAFSATGRIPERDLFFLKGLNEVADNIVFVSSAPLFPDEADKMEGLVTEVAWEPHREYDFGSYKRGRRIAEERGLLDPSVADELILCNDSCYGPVFPLSESFAEMASRNCDFWGFTTNNEQGSEHLQTYFMVFRRAVLDAPALGDFLDGVQELTGRNSVVVLYESKLTKTLCSAGFSFDSFVPRDFCEKVAPGLSPSPVQWPLTTMSKFRMPLVKVKALSAESMEDAGKTLDYVRAVNPEAVSFMSIREPLKSSRLRHGTALAARIGLPGTYPAKAARLREKVSRGEPVRCVLFAASADTATAAALCEDMAKSKSPKFSPRVCIAPDMRLADPEQGMDAYAAELSERLGRDLVLRPVKTPDDVWPDVLRDADIAVYPPDFRYFPFTFRPTWAIGRHFLPALALRDGEAGDDSNDADFVFWKCLPKETIGAQI